MAISHYSSMLQTVNAPAEKVFDYLADLKNVERYYRSIPQEKLSMIQQVEFAVDEIKVKIDGLGPKFDILITDRNRPSLIRYTLKESQLIKDFHTNLLIQVLDQLSCEIQITIDVELPMMLKMMVGSKIQPALDNAVKILSTIPFSRII